MAEVELSIADRTYRVACRNGEEGALQSAAALVDLKSREAIAGLGTLSESRQLLFASLLLADQIVEQRDGAAGQQQREMSAPDDSMSAERIERLAQRLESLAVALEDEAPSA